MRARPKTFTARFILTAILVLLLIAAQKLSCFAAPPPSHAKLLSSARSPQKRFLMAHYMPWYQAKPFSQTWGWHWTMNHFNPDRITGGKQEAASHYRPLIGLYDSNDPDALQCQVMQMKLAGIDGVIFDWYGTDSYYDYADVNRNTERLIPYLKKAGLRFAICYEDQSVVQEIKGGKFSADASVTHGQQLMAWMQQHFFSSPNYLTIHGRPVLLTFGEPYYSGSQWNQIFAGLPQPPLYFTETVLRAKPASIGAFDWPIPQGGDTGAKQAQDSFYTQAKSWPVFIAAAYPRFDDIYQEAGTGQSLGKIEDRQGQTYAETLRRALLSKAPIIQLVTWNDWGEGTQIEPSQEFGNRDLVTTQRLRRQYLDPHCAYAAQDLLLPVEWYRVRKKYIGNKSIYAKLGAVFPLVTSGHLAHARSLLAHYQPKSVRK